MKNKKQKQFAQKRFIYFAEVQQFNEGELAEVKKAKGEEKDELNVGDLVSAVNGEINKHSDQLSDLPKEYLNLLHDEIKNYLTQSPGRYDKDTVKGLNAQEFKAYVGDMQAKVAELMKEYAPTEEEKKQLQEAKNKAKEGAEKAEKIKPVEAEDIKEDPGKIENVQQLQEKYTEYDGWNASLQKEGTDALTATSGFQKSLADYQKSISGLNSYRKFGKFFSNAFTSGDLPEIKTLKDAQSAAKGKVDGISKKYADSKDKLKKYGEALGNVSNTLKDEKIKERDEKLVKVKEKQTETGDEKKAREEKKKQLEDQQKQMQGKRDDLAKYQEDVKKGKDLGENRLETAKMKKDQLGQFSDVLKTSLAKIDESLKNPNISEEQKKQLEEAKKTLQDKSNEADDGLRVTDQVIENEGTAAVTLGGEADKSAAKSLSLKSHLETQVNPALKSLDVSIQALDDAKMQYASEEEQTLDYYKKGLDIYDNIDKAVDDSVLKNNLANEQVTKSLENSAKFLDNTKVEAPGFWESTVGVIPSTIGGALSKFGEFCCEQSQWLSRELDNNKKDMNPVLYALARVGVEVVSFTIGTAGGLLEMGGGILNMVGTPGDSLKGLGALIGRDPLTGEFSGSTAGDAWKNMGKSLISYEDFKEGRIGLGLGKIFPNLVLAITGSSAIGAGSKAAEAAATVAREAGQGVLSTTGKAVLAFGKGAVGDIAESATGALKSVKGVFVGTGEEASGLSKLKNAAQAAPAKIVEVAKAAPAKIVEAAKAAPTKIVEAAKTAPGKIAEIATEGGQALASQVERLWGGKKFEAARLAKTQLGLVEELGSKSGKYEEFQNAMKKLKEENPGLDDKQLRLKLSQQNLQLFTEGFQYEKGLADLEKAQQAFENAFNKSIKDPATADAAKVDLSNIKNAQKGMIDTAGGFNEFKKLVDKKDPKALEAAKKYQEALAKGDPDALRILKEQNPQWKDAFQNMDYRGQAAASERNLVVFKMSDDIQYNVRTKGVDSLDHLEDLAKKAKTPEELDILDRAMAECLKKGQANPAINRAINEGKIPAGPLMIDALIDLHGSYVLKINNLEFSPKQQGKLLGKIMEFNGDSEALIRQLIAENKIDFANPEAIKGLLTKPDKFDIVKKLIEEGKIDVTNPKVINELAASAKGGEVALELILEGKSPLTKEIFANSMDSEDALLQLEKLINDPKIKFEEGMTKEKMLKEIEWKRDAWADQKTIQRFKVGPNDPKYAEKLAELKQMFEEATSKLKNGEPIQSEVGDILKRLKERDPEAYNLLLNSDTGRLIGNECMDGIIGGNKLEFIDSNGQKVTAYNGKYIAKGGMGSVDHVAYVLPGGEKFEIGVIKRPLANRKDFFKAEVEAAKEVQPWNHPNVVKPLHITDDFIIYESGEGAMDLWKGEQVMPAKDYFKALRDTADGILEYERQGKFHGDIKEGNVIVVQVGTDQLGKPIYQAKLIDNSPVDYARAGGVRYSNGGIGRDFPHTPSGVYNGSYEDLWAFNDQELDLAKTKLGERGITGGEANAWLARASDARAYGKMLENALNRHVPGWNSNPELFNTVMSLKSVITAGDRGLIEYAKNVVNGVLADLERGGTGQTNVIINMGANSGSINTIQKLGGTAPLGPGAVPPPAPLGGGTVPLAPAVLSGTPTIPKAPEFLTGTPTVKKMVGSGTPTIKKGKTSGPATIKDVNP